MRFVWLALILHHMRKHIALNNTPNGVHRCVPMLTSTKVRNAVRNVYVTERRNEDESYSDRIENLSGKAGLRV